MKKLLVTASRRKAKYNTLVVSTLLILLVISYIPALELAGTLFCFASIAIFLWISGQGPRSLGLIALQNWGETILVCATAATLLSAAYKFGMVPFLEFLLQVKKPVYSNLDFIRGNVANLLMVDAFMWLVGAFGEELVFRGFVLNYLIQIFGESTKMKSVALVLSACLFGCAHYQWGAVSVVANCIDGLVLGSFFLRSGNLWLTILIHGFMNSISLVFIYLNWDKLL